MQARTLAGPQGLLPPSKAGLAVSCQAHRAPDRRDGGESLRDIS